MENNAILHNKLTLMEIVAGILSLIAFIGFVILCETVKKIRINQEKTNRLLTDMNNQMSEQISILKKDYTP